MNAKQIEAKILNSYYIILIVAYLLSVFSSFRPAVFMLFVNVLLFGLRVVQTAPRFIVGLNLGLFIFLWSFLTAILGIFSNSLLISINSLLYITTPMVCFFSVNNEFVEPRKFYLSFLVAIILNDLLGTICFYLKPKFFVDFISRISESSYDQLMHHAGLGRLITIFGSIETGTLSAFAVIICLGFLISRTLKYKFLVPSLVIALSALILTQQRGPLFSIVAVLLFMIIYSNRERLVNPMIFIIVFFTAIIVMYLLSIYRPTIFNWIVERMTNPFDAVTERFSYQWDVLVNNLNPIQWIVGKGIGAFGFFVENSNRNTRIFDQMYFNIIGEMGIVGLFAFLCIIIMSVKRFFRNVKGFFVPFFIIFEVAFTGLGTTLTYYPQIMPIFWFAVGMLLRDKIFDCDLND